MSKMITVSIEIEEFDSMSQLAEEDEVLMARAIDSAASAYAPYSNFHVGAAVLLENGETVTGNNQENVAYPSGLCAERVALFTAGAHFPDVPIKTIAITAQSESFDISEPLAPCGACRQVMVEYEKKYTGKIRVILKGETGKIWVVQSINDILPFSFSSDKLKSL
ncbi:MAG TPA: cytidine deaminase [Flavobacteriales bacterium]|nr:cytidine deaminase [Flavobacteriales bacterium]